METKLDNKRALVLGASRGLGAGIAKALAEEGAQVMIASRDWGRLEMAARDLEAQTGATVHAQVCDLASAEAVDRLAETAHARMGGVDILVNNAGGPPPGSVTEATDAQWRSTFETVVLAPVRLTRMLLPGMRDRRWGRILTVVSSGVAQPIPNLGLSNALRMAVVGWSKTLAEEVAAEGITVNCLAPGRIHTDRIDELDKKAAERRGVEIEVVREASRASIPAGRYGEVAEFAAVAAFLASERASYVTGSVLRADGGLIRAV